MVATEVDGYAGYKYLGSYKTASGTIIPINSRRKYANEWYFFDPASNNSYSLKGRHPSPHTTYYNYNKGELRMHRWN